MKCYATILAFFLCFTGVTFAQQTNENLTIEDVAPNMPQRPATGSLLDYPNYRIAMDQWVEDYPHEFENAVEIDASLRLFAPPKSRNPKPGDRALSEPPLNALPPFMNYPVNDTKPFFIDNRNPDYDSLVYKRKLQHWYYLFDSAGYVNNYGIMPDLPDSVKGLTHPDQFAPGLDTAQYLPYYPEFE